MNGFTSLPDRLIEPAWNAIDAEGKITRVIRKLDSQSTYRATRMIYNGGKQVEYVVGEEWTVEDDAVACEDYCRTFVWRYRYDGPRQRYMREKLDPDNITTVLETSWSDYDGNEVYTDFHVDSGDHVIDRAYETAFGEFPDPDSGTTSIQYYHRDQIGTTRVMTCDTNLNNCTAGGNGEPPITRRRVYTAFGEQVSTSGSVDSRYRYAGAHGYQSHDDFPFLHVGARWYDPETGRFLQRDPIGIEGGLNTYEYVGGSPTHSVDPDGLDALDVRSGLWEDAFLRGDEEAGRDIISAQAAGCVAGLTTVGIALGGYYGIPHAARFLPVRYSGHAIQRMREYGLHHSIVKNAIRHGVRSAGNTPRTTVYVYERVIVVRNWWGRVVTTIKKGRDWVRR